MVFKQIPGNYPSTTPDDRKSFRESRFKWRVVGRVGCAGEIMTWYAGPGKEREHGDARRSTEIHGGKAGAFSV